MAGHDIRETAPRLVHPPTLLQGHTEAVQRLGVARQLSQRALETTLGRLPLPVPQLGLPQPHPTLGGARLQPDERPERIGRPRKIALLLEQATQIEMRRGKIAVELERMLVGVRRLARLPGGMQGDPEVVPRLAIAGQEFDRRPQPAESLGRLPRQQEALAIQQGPWPRRRTAGQGHGQPQDRDHPAPAAPHPFLHVSGRQHAVSGYPACPVAPSGRAGHRFVMAIPRVILTLLLLCQPFYLPAADVGFAEPSILDNSQPGQPRVVIVQDPKATHTLSPQPEAVAGMVQRGLLHLTGRDSVAEAWHALVKTQDVVGIKVHSIPGPDSGTRPAVAAAIIRSLLSAGHPAAQIVIWDRRLSDLRSAGFEEVAATCGVRIAGALDAGYDAAVSYENPMLGQLVYGDLEFERGNRGLATNIVAGRKSHFSRLLTRDITRHVIVAPLLNHNLAGANGVLYSIASATTDNFLRFEASATLLASAVPEIFNHPLIADRVALCVVDALLGQYEGGQRSLLHRSIALNELRFGRDPVAMDILSLEELNRLRETAGQPPNTNRNALCVNAALLELGTDDPRKIDVRRIE